MQLLEEPLKIENQCATYKLCHCLLTAYAEKVEWVCVSSLTKSTGVITQACRLNFGSVVARSNANYFPDIPWFMGKSTPPWLWSMSKDHLFGPVVGRLFALGDSMDGRVILKQIASSKATLSGMIFLTIWSHCMLSSLSQSRQNMVLLRCFGIHLPPFLDHTANSQGL